MIGVLLYLLGGICFLATYLCLNRHYKWETKDSIAKEDDSMGNGTMYLMMIIIWPVILFFALLFGLIKGIEYIVNQTLPDK